MHTFLLKAAQITFQWIIQSTTYILHIEEFLAVLLYAENVMQLFCTIVCSLMMGKLYYCDFNKNVSICWFKNVIAHMHVTPKKATPISHPFNFVK